MKYTIYLLKLNDEVVYIGKSINVENRLKEHVKNKIFNRYALLECATEADMHVLEIYLIVTIKPLYNKDCATPSTPSFDLGIDISSLQYQALESEPFTAEREAEGTLIGNRKILGVNYTKIPTKQMRPKEMALQTTIVNAIPKILENRDYISASEFRDWVYDNANKINGLEPSHALFMSNRFLKDNFSDFIDELLEIETVGRSKRIIGVKDLNK